MDGSAIWYSPNAPKSRPRARFALYVAAAMLLPGLRADAADAGLSDLLRMLASPERTLASMQCRDAFARIKRPEDALVAGAVCGDGDAVERLLTAGVSVDAYEGADAKQRTALHRAAGSGPEAMVDFLIARGATVDKPALDGGTALETAAWHGRAAVVRRLLEKGANPNLAGYHGGPLHSAVGGGHLEVVDVLLKAGANPNLRIGPIGIEPGGTPLHRHAWRGVWPSFPQILDRLIKAGADVNAKATNDKTPLDVSEMDSLLPLLRRGARSGSGRQEDVVARAAWKGHVEALTELIAAGYSVNSATGTRSPLHYALERFGSEDDMPALMLVDAGANATAVDKSGWTPLEIAVNHCRARVVQRILQRGGWPNDMPLTKALSSLGGRRFDSPACPQMVLDVVRVGADVNLPDAAGQTPLFTALHSARITELLLKSGARANVVDRAGRSPLHYPSRASPWSMRMLVKAGVDPNAPDPAGDRPLHRAALERGYAVGLDLFQALIESGASISERNKAGHTPLELLRANLVKRGHTGRLDRETGEIVVLLGGKPE